MLIPIEIAEKLKNKKVGSLSSSDFEDIAKSFKPILMPMFANESFAAKFMQSAFIAINNKALQNSDPISVFGAVLNAASIGLTLNPALGQAYIVAYNTKVGENEWKSLAQLQIGYRGYVDKMYNTGHVLSVMPNVVRFGDAFEYEYGTTPYIKHTPTSDEKKAITHAYCVVNLRGGVQMFEICTAATIERLRLKNRSQTDKNGDNSPKDAWKSDYAKMALKCPIRQIVPYLPMSENLELLLSYDEQIVRPQYDKKGNVEAVKSDKEPHQEAELTEIEIEKIQISAQWLSNQKEAIDKMLNGITEHKEGKDKIAEYLSGAKYLEISKNFTEKDRMELADYSKQKLSKLQKAA